MVTAYSWQSSLWSVRPSACCLAAPVICELLGEQRLDGALLDEHDVIINLQGNRGGEALSPNCCRSLLLPLHGATSGRCRLCCSSMAAANCITPALQEMLWRIGVGR